MEARYFLLFKTAQAEFRAWRNLESEVRDQISPIVEITRGRKIPKSGKDIDEALLPTVAGIYDLEKNISLVEDNFIHSKQVFLDITREPSLQSYEIGALGNSANGYEKWVDFIDKMKARVPNAFPTLIINPSNEETEDEYKSNLFMQFDKFASKYSKISYRALLLTDSDFLIDIHLLIDRINKYIAEGNEFYLVLDHEFIRSGMGILHALRTINLIVEIRKMVPDVSLVIIGTSFPKNVEELGGEDDGSFPTEENYLYDEIIKQINDNEKIFYGDYGSINPIRNDVVMRGGWRPRIDYTTSDKRIFYYREKRIGNTYQNHYASVASKIVKDSKFQDISNSWGVQQIKDAAIGKVPASSPSFWISVRMEIFIHRQLENLKIIR